jgi:hypothetical protein
MSVKPYRSRTKLLVRGAWRQNCALADDAQLDSFPKGLLLIERKGSPSQ